MIHTAILKALIADLQSVGITATYHLGSQFAENITPCPELAVYSNYHPNGDPLDPPLPRFQVSCYRGQLMINEMFTMLNRQIYDLTDPTTIDRAIDYLKAKLLHWELLYRSRTK